jgi:hypothetical protein
MYAELHRAAMHTASLVTRQGGNINKIGKRMLMNEDWTRDTRRRVERVEDDQSDIRGDMGAIWEAIDELRKTKNTQGQLQLQVNHLFHALSFVARG